MDRDECARREDFLAMLAHELRNPISVIGNAVQLLEAEGETGEIYNMIRRQTKHLTRLVEDLLDVSRISRGKIVLQKQVCDLKSLVEHGVETAQQAIADKKHTLILELKKKKIWVHADPTRMYQVFSNLLLNAAKYTPPGGNITVTIENDDKFAFVNIKDTGLGLEDSEAIFDLFYQVDTGLARSQGGLGIGLTLVRNILNMHNGSVAAYSEGIGKGSTFSVHMPISLMKPEKVTETGIATCERRRILVVDDMPDVAHSMSLILKSQGHEVYTASSGRAALQFVKNVKPQYILLDIGMPDMDGWELAKKIKEIDKTVITIAITGYGMEEDKQKSKEDFNYHLVKPVERQDLFMLIK